MRAWGTEISEADGFVADVDAVWNKACYADTSFLRLLPATAILQTITGQVLERLQLRKRSA